jgi:hypothetical protein
MIGEKLIDSLSVGFGRPFSPSREAVSHISGDAAAIDLWRHFERREKSRSLAFARDDSPLSGHDRAVSRGRTEGSLFPAIQAFSSKAGEGLLELATS